MVTHHETGHLVGRSGFAQRHGSQEGFDGAAIREGLIKAGISESHIETSDVGLVGYATDIGPISLKPMAVVGVRSHSDVEKAVRFANDHNLPITGRGA